MKLVLIFAALHAAAGEITGHRLRAHAPSGVLSLLQEEPSDIKKNGTTLAATPDQISIADEKVLPVNVLAASNATDATNASAAVKVVTDAEEGADDAAEDSSEDKDAAVASEEDEKPKAPASEPKPIFDVEAIEQSLLNLKKTQGAASPGMMKFVEKVNVMIKDMEAKVQDAHNKDQSLLYDYRNQFTKCRKGRTTSAAAIASFRKQKNRENTQHRSCRHFEKLAFKVRDDCDQLLVSKREAQTAACGALRDLQRNPSSEANNCHPSHSERFPLWLRRNEVWFTYKRQEYQAAKKRCSDAKKAVAKQTPICQVKNRRHIVMVGRCNTKQDFFEKTSCGLSKELSRTCHKYTNCWIDTRHDYLAAKPGIMNMEKDRKGEWRVLKRVACLLDVFASKDGNVDAKVIDECKEKTHTTQHLNLFYPPVPPQEKCPAIPSVPGQGRFYQAFYSSLPFDAKSKRSQTCIVEAGGGIVLGTPKGTTKDKCLISAGFLKASNDAYCKVSNERRHPVKVDFQKNRFTTYKFKMSFQGRTTDKNNVPGGGIRFCGGASSRWLKFADSSDARRWGWSIKQQSSNNVWSYYNNKNDRLTGFFQGKPGKANPDNNKMMDMEVTTEWSGHFLKLYSWKVNGVVLSKYKNHWLCWGSSVNDMVPSVTADSGTKSVKLGDFKVYQGSNPVMSSVQIIGEGVPRTPLTVRCGRKSEAQGNRVPGAGNKRVSNPLMCQQYCAEWSGCVAFVYTKDGICKALWKVTRYVTRPGAMSGPPACTQPYSTGLRAEFYWMNKGISRMPNLAFRKPDQTRIDLTVNYANSGGYWPGVRREDRYAVRWSGSIYIKHSGIYHFQIISDDGSHLWIDNNKILNNGGEHGFRARVLRTHMTAGWHAIKLVHFENGGAAGMHLKYHGPDTMFGWSFLPTEVLRPEMRVKGSASRGPFGTADDETFYKYPTQSRILKKGSKTYVLITARGENLHIALSKESLGNPVRIGADTYNAVIGGWGNTKSCLKRGLPHAACTSHPVTVGIASKGEFRKFWMSVDSKTKEIAVGRGHNINKYDFMKFTDGSVFEPKGLAVMTGWGSTGEWVFNTPYGKSNSPRQSFGKSAWYLGDVGKDCTDTCASEGRVCDSDIRQGFSYNKFREYVANEMGASCIKDTRAWFGQEQPSYLVDGPDGNQGKCLASRNIPLRVRCSASHAKAMRWCKCSASTQLFSYTYVGKKPWNSMEKLAEAKKGRLMTLDEARLVLKRRGMRPIVPGQDAWAAVTNPASTCKVTIGEKEYLMDWVQIGNRGHWTGKSHTEFHGCPNWGNWARRPHFDSGYLMMSKERR